MSAKYPGLPPTGTFVRIMRGKHEGALGKARHYCMFELCGVIDSWVVVELGVSDPSHIPDLVAVPLNDIAVMLEPRINL